MCQFCSIVRLALDARIASIEPPFAVLALNIGIAAQFPENSPDETQRLPGNAPDIVGRVCDCWSTPYAKSCSTQRR